MGQIQNAITGLVSTAVGATVASEVQNQRLIDQAGKDVKAVTEQIEGYKKHEAAAKGLSGEALTKAEAALQEEYTKIKGWQSRVQTRLNALKRKGVESLDLEIAVKQANERIDKAHTDTTGGNK